MKMKTFILIASSILLIQELSAQELFQRVYGGESYDVGREVIQTADDGYLIAGSTGSFGLTSGQIMLIKTDFQGYEEWRRYYGNDYADQLESMQETVDGNLILGGYTEQSGNSYQVYALKLTMDGDTIWTRSYGGTAWDFCRQLVSLPDGGFALFGQTYSHGSGNGDFYLLRLNSDGDTLWTKTYGGSGTESGESIALAADGGFFLAGYTNSFGAGKNDIYVVRTDDQGDTLWTKTFGGPEDDFCYAVGAMLDGGYVLAGGSFNHEPNPGRAIYIVIKDGGSMQWTKYDPFGVGNNYWTDVLIEPGTANITCVGYYVDGGYGKDDGRIIRYGADGIWNGMARGHGSEEVDRFYDVKQTSDGGYIMVGETQGFLNRFDDVYLVKGDGFGIAVDPELGVNEIEVQGETFGVQIGPNPFSSSDPTLFIQDYTSLERKLDAPMEFKMYNGLGQQVSYQIINTGNSVLHSRSLNNGIYHYQLVSGNTILATGKAVKVN